MRDPKESQEEPVQRPSAAEESDKSAEEQMALYEESLKHSDWGHQPC
jgi:hypothetical protein